MVDDYDIMRTMRESGSRPVRPDDFQSMAYGMPVVTTSYLPRGMAMIVSGLNDFASAASVVVGVGTLTPMQEFMVEYNAMLRRVFPSKVLREGTGYTIADIQRRDRAEVA